MSQEVQQEMQDSVEEKATASELFVRKLLSGGKLSPVWAASHLPFVVFLFFLAVIYIANRHYTEDMVREIDKTSKEVKVMGWEFKTLQADLMLKSTQSAIASKVDTFGLKVLVEPPIKLKRVKKE